LDAESLRDAMLACSGELSLTVGGPYVPSRFTERLEVVVNEEGGAFNRRTIYLQQHRSQMSSLLKIFDAPMMTPNCTRRQSSTTPLQSLTMLNSDFVTARARRFADRLERASSNTYLKIELAFVLSIGRFPDERERDSALRFLESQSTYYRGHFDSNTKALADFCHSIFVSNLFLYID
jgi:hypothetical protein